MAINQEPQNSSSSEAQYNEFDAEKKDNLPSESTSFRKSQENSVTEDPVAEDLSESLTTSISSDTTLAKQSAEKVAREENQNESPEPNIFDDDLAEVADNQTNNLEDDPATVSYEPLVSENASVPVKPVKPSGTAATKLDRQRPWWMAWQLWGATIVILSGGVGYAATSMLLKLPETQSCTKVLWPVASASVRLYCAQTYAEAKSVKGLLAAIDLVAVLPESHPLRPEIDRNIERWATAILEVGEQQFQQGELQQAIATAQQIPETVEAHKLVEAKIENWQSIWTEGENTYAEVEKRLRSAKWNEAFSWAVRLTDSRNEYWATTKYQESIDNINIAQEENASLGKAQDRLANGSVEDLLAAIDKAKAIKEKSYAYEQAQKIVAQAKSKLLDNAETLIQQQNWSQLLQVTNRIPYSLGMSDRVKEWNVLAGAGTSASLDTVYGMEEAISEAKKLKPGSKYYDTAQKLISRWELEIGDIKHLSTARELARVGTISNLNRAIAEVSKIPSSNPRYSEARQEMLDWRRQVQTIEDQPVLNRAKELAFGNNKEAWRRAIAEANLISRGSPLYDEAQNNVRTWRANIERIEDRPILDRAVALAESENYAAAVEQAGKIRSGTALYSEAQDKINTWRQELEARQYFRDARVLSERGTPEDLAKAIITIRQVGTETSVRPEVLPRITRWSSQILAMARAASNDSLAKAIAIAEQIPAGTASYDAAQAEIKAWQEELRPPKLEPITTPLPPSFKLDKLEKNRRNDDEE